MNLFLRLIIFLLLLLFSVSSLLVLLLSCFSFLPFSFSSPASSSSPSLAYPLRILSSFSPLLILLLLPLCLVPLHTL